MDSLIRWRRGDYIKLGQAVSRFNKIINELDTDEREFLPDLKEYKEIKEHIMAIKFQYNKTSLQQLEKQLKMRERSLPTIKSKESALRIEVKRTKDEVTRLELQLEQEAEQQEEKPENDAQAYMRHLRETREDQKQQRMERKRTGDMER